MQPMRVTVMRQGPLTSNSADHALATGRCIAQKLRPTLGLEFVVRASALGHALVCSLKVLASVSRRGLSSCNAIIKQDLVGNGTGIVLEISKFDLGVCGGSARRSVTDGEHACAPVCPRLPLGRLSMP